MSSDLTLALLRNARKLARLGKWRARKIKPETLLERIPVPDGPPAPGLNPGLACILHLIPRKQWPLSAILHADYTPEAVDQVRREIAAGLEPDCETCWWLAGWGVCEEGVKWDAFISQIARMSWLKNDPLARQKAAQKAWARVKSSFEIDSLHGIPYCEIDGGMQAAYLAGHPVAVQYASNYGIWFIGTYLESLGLEEFSWSNETDEQGRKKSGPVHGSKQFVKCATQEELDRALLIVRQKFNI